MGAQDETGFAASTSVAPPAVEPPIENRTFDEIDIGATASLVRTLSWRDVELFAVMSGDINPAHVDEEYARSDRFHGIVAHGMWGASLISTLLGTRLSVIRPVVRDGIDEFGDRTVGFRDGWRGVLEGSYIDLDIEATRGILPRGGTDFTRMA